MIQFFPEEIKLHVAGYIFLIGSIMLHIQSLGFYNNKQICFMVVTTLILFTAKQLKCKID